MWEQQKDILHRYEEKLDETMMIRTLPSGVRCYIIPKKGYIEKFAMIVTKYGSCDNCFRVGGKTVTVPDGIAHFLEHKLFEDKKRNLFDSFTQLGASVNAFTNFTSTAYYCNGNENFDESLLLLLDFVQNPYFTEENVEKEKGIIEQEIRMYEDSPFWMIYLNLMNAMYSKLPVRKNIAGSVESIANITKAMLDQCYDTFYLPENMAVVCSGDLDAEHIFGLVEKHIKRKKGEPIDRIYGDEPEECKLRAVKQEMSLARSMFQFGFKDSDFQTGLAEKGIATKIVMDMLVGQSSEFYEKLYDRGLVDSPLHIDYMGGTFYGSAVFSGSSEQPEKVCELIEKELESVENNGLDANRFEKIKHKHMGRFIRSFNNIENIVTGQADLSGKNLDLFDMLRTYEAIDMQTLQNRCQKIFTPKNHALSVITTKSKE